jgi:hypothetical protein
MVSDIADGDDSLTERAKDKEVLINKIELMKEVLINEIRQKNEGLTNEIMMHYQSSAQPTNPAPARNFSPNFIQLHPLPIPRRRRGHLGRGRYAECPDVCMSDDWKGDYTAVEKIY